MDTIKVLIVEDDEDDYFLLQDTLKSIKSYAFEQEWANSYTQGLARLKAQQHDVYVIDYILGPKNGLDMIREALASGCTQPMILLTGMNSEAIDETAAQTGAFDYLVKDSLNPERLARSIRYALAQAASAKALRESERKYRTIFQQSRDMIFLTDVNGLFLSISDVAETMTGYAVQELLGKQIVTLMEEPQLAKYLLNRILQDGQIANFQLNIKTKQGDALPCALYLSRHKDQNGEEYYQGVLHDTTTEIREKRASIMFSKIEATGRLMRTLAHEVRNPLTNINLALEGIGLSELEQDHEVFDYVDIIRRNSARINDLVTQLLNSARPPELDTQPCSMRSVLQETLAETFDRLALKRMKCVEQYEVDDDLVLLDVAKIKIAFTNFIVNAVEAMTENEGCLTVGSKLYEDRIVVYFKDNGVGIPAEHLNKLFEPYFTSKPNGIGLGLASTLNILNSHGAHVEVDSEVGKGSTFSMCFARWHPQ